VSSSGPSEESGAALKVARSAANAQPACPARLLAEVRGSAGSAGRPTQRGGHPDEVHGATAGQRLRQRHGAMQTRGAEGVNEAFVPARHGSAGRVRGVSGGPLTYDDVDPYDRGRHRVSASSPGLLTGNPPTRWGAPGESPAGSATISASAGPRGRGRRCGGRSCDTAVTRTPRQPLRLHPLRLLLLRRPRRCSPGFPVDATSTCSASPAVSVAADRPTTSVRRPSRPVGIPA
jgi:hypothetical protein